MNCSAACICRCMYTVRPQRKQHLPVACTGTMALSSSHNTTDTRGFLGARALHKGQINVSTTQLSYRDETTYVRGACQQLRTISTILRYAQCLYFTWRCSWHSIEDRHHDPPEHQEQQRPHWDKSIHMKNVVCKLHMYIWPHVWKWVTRLATQSAGTVRTGAVQQQSKCSRAEDFSL